MYFVYKIYDVTCKQVNDQLILVNKNTLQIVTCKYHHNINMRLVCHSDV